MTPSPDTTQVDMLTSRLAAAADADPRWAELAERLLATGGQLLAVTAEPHLSELLGRGRDWPAAEARSQPGDISRCHTNALALWTADRSQRVVTGWALSDDSIWRQHSWAVTHDPELTVIETTEPRTAYYGFELTDDEAGELATANGLAVPRRAARPNRNGPCRCGSGAKTKKCCGA